MSYVSKCDNCGIELRKREEEQEFWSIDINHHDDKLWEHGKADLCGKCAGEWKELERIMGAVLRYEKISESVPFRFTPQKELPKATHETYCAFHKIGICDCGLLAKLRYLRSPEYWYPDFNKDMEKTVEARKELGIDK